MAKFPPLPEPDIEGSEPGIGDFSGYTATQLRARDLEIWRMAMEEAAAHCNKVGIRAFSPMQDDGARECAAAIRALPEPGHE